MASIERLEKEIEKIKERNRRVEGDKVWETSWTRRIFIATSTYILISIFLMIVHVDKPFLSAIIPAVAYLLSTFSLGILKSWWFKIESSDRIAADEYKGCKNSWQGCRFCIKTKSPKQNSYKIFKQCLK